MKLKNSALIMILLLFSIPAWSLVEVRVTYTGLTNSPNKNLLYSGSYTIPSTKPTTGIGADLIFELPMSGINFGVRYENFAINYKGNSLEFDGDASRTSALLGWRWIDTLVYFGPVLTYGLSHSGGNMKVTENTTTVVSDLSAGKQSSYTAGLELGGKFLGLRVGAEAGYMSYIWKNLSGTSGTITSVNKLDMSGSYAKIVIGFGL